MKDLNFAIVGCGGVGRKRLETLRNARTVALVDSNLSADLRLSNSFPNSYTVPYEDVLVDVDIDAVIVSTTHDALADIACEALAAGKHVLVEKPAGCSSMDINRIIAAQRLASTQHFTPHVRVGFNHRYHPAIRKAFELTQSGQLGALMMVRGRYGHGGRLGYDKEWRSIPAKGGGELLDQGVHLIDLASMFLQEQFVNTTGYARTFFWNQVVDDNAFMILQTEPGQIAHLHVSSTEWKNLFSLEIYGTHGKLHMEGLGGSYGVERLSYYRMLPEMGPPETTIWEFPALDRSWQLEMDEFVEDIRLKRSPSVGLQQALSAMQVVEAIKEQSK